jgi:hypothetical protein
MDAMSPKRPVSRLALALIVLSALVGAGATVMIAREFLGSVNRPSFAVPGTATVDLERDGTWAVYERTGTHTQAGPVSITNNIGARHRVADITVTGPDGSAVTVDPLMGSETITRDNGAIFSAVAEFKAPAAGRYEVTIEGDPEGEAIVAPELSQQFLHIVPWILAAIAAGLVLLGACIGLVVSLVRRNRVSGPSRTAGGPPLPG